MFKVMLNCVYCDTPLRSRSKGKDWKTRMLHVKCFKETGYNYYQLKRLFPQRVKAFFSLVNINGSE